MNKKQLLSITAIGTAITIVITWGILNEPSDQVLETNAQTILISCEDDLPLHLIHKLLAPHGKDKEALCVVNSLQSISETEDRQTVLNTFLDISTILKQTRPQNCHMIGHHLGLFLYNYTDNLIEAFSLIDLRCTASFYHGTMQSYFTNKLLSDNGTPTNVVAIKVCDELVDVSHSRVRLECAHGIGHGEANLLSPVCSIEDSRSCGKFSRKESRHVFGRLQARFRHRRSRGDARRGDRRVHPGRRKR